MGRYSPAVFGAQLDREQPPFAGSSDKWGLFKAQGLVISVVFREAGQKLLGALLLRMVDDLLGIALLMKPPSMKIT